VVAEQVPVRNQVPPGFGVEPRMAAVASQVLHIQEPHIDPLQVGLHSLELGPHIQELVLHNLELLQGLDMLELHSQELHNQVLELHRREAVASQGPVLVLHLPWFQLFSFLQLPLPLTEVTARLSHFSVGSSCLVGL